jgi:hypothetical protein
MPATPSHHETDRTVETTATGSVPATEPARPERGSPPSPPLAGGGPPPFGPELSLLAGLGLPLERPLLLLGRPGGPPPPGFGGPGGPMAQDRKLVRQFDRDGDGRLSRAERQAARASLKEEQGPQPGGAHSGLPHGFGPPGEPGGRTGREPPQAGPRVSPADVPCYPDAALYEPTVLRTLFLEFEDSDWEAELADFYHTDVEVPATLTVDGRRYPNVGVHFRGNSSFFMAGAGFKRSLNLSLDDLDSEQRLYGYKTLNLLNSAEDPTFLRTVLYSHIARHYLPAPRANHVKVVINGESWGIYVNAQQFDKPFLREWFPDARGTRWKVPVSFGGGGGLSYLGDDVADYQRRYEMKSDDGVKAWRDLIALCRTLSQAPLDQLEDAVRPRLDLDHVLWYLALDNVLINGDGYWTRASDYNLFRDSAGQFHVIPHDVNETFKRAGGPGFERGARGSGVELDPLTGADDPAKPLLSRLLAVPRLREAYLRHVRTLAEEWLDWNRLGPTVQQLQSLIDAEVAADTRKLYPAAASQPAASRPAVGEVSAGRRFGPGGRGPELSLEDFVTQRRAYLLNHPEIRKLDTRKP